MRLGRIASFYRGVPLAHGYIDGSHGLFVHDRDPRDKFTDGGGAKRAPEKTAGVRPRTVVSSGVVAGGSPREGVAPDAAVRAQINDWIRFLTEPDRDELQIPTIVNCIRQAMGELSTEGGSVRRRVVGNCARDLIHGRAHFGFCYLSYVEQLSVIVELASHLDPSQVGTENYRQQLEALRIAAQLMGSEIAALDRGDRGYQGICELGSRVVRGEEDPESVLQAVTTPLERLALAECITGEDSVMSLYHIAQVLMGIRAGLIEQHRDLFDALMQTRGGNLGLWNLSAAKQLVSLLARGEHKGAVERQLLDIKNNLEMLCPHIPQPLEGEVEHLVGVLYDGRGVARGGTVRVRFKYMSCIAQIEVAVVLSKTLGEVSEVRSVFRELSKFIVLDDQKLNENGVDFMKIVNKSMFVNLPGAGIHRVLATVVTPFERLALAEYLVERASTSRSLYKPPMTLVELLKAIQSLMLGSGRQDFKTRFERIFLENATSIEELERRARSYSEEPHSRRHRERAGRARRKRVPHTLQKHYRVLGLAPYQDLTQDGLKAAYRKLVARWHPDKVSEEKMDEALRRVKEINSARDAILKHYGWS